MSQRDFHSCCSLSPGHPPPANTPPPPSFHLLYPLPGTVFPPEQVSAQMSPPRGAHNGVGHCSPPPAPLPPLLCYGSSRPLHPRSSSTESLLCVFPTERPSPRRESFAGSQRIHHCLDHLGFSVHVCSMMLDREHRKSPIPGF